VNIGAWTFIVHNCVFGFCIPNESVQVEMFKTETDCVVTAQLYDELTNIENVVLGYPVYYTESQCFNWVEYLETRKDVNK
jgi:hypothetical protein